MGSLAPASTVPGVAGTRTASLRHSGLFYPTQNLPFLQRPAPHLLLYCARTQTSTHVTLLRTWPVMTQTCQSTCARSPVATVLTSDRRHWTMSRHHQLSEHQTTDTLDNVTSSPTSFPSLFSDQHK